MPIESNETIRQSKAVAPVVEAGKVPKEPEEGIALCLSGGGYRAMLFHTGALWRIYEADLLKELDRISSVSGGSITSALLGLNWAPIAAGPGSDPTPFIASLVDPIRSLASTTIDWRVVIKGLLRPGSISQEVQKVYRRYLYGGATLQDLPDRPRFIFNATNVQSGVLWRFSKPYLADYRVGMIDKPRLQLAVAVAASSAFPPFLSPTILRFDPKSFNPGSGQDLQKEPYTSRVILTDGGVYDNLGLETAWKRYRTILASDGGAQMKPEGRPKTDWGRHVYRVLGIIGNQVDSLRKRQLIYSYVNKSRQGAYWGIRTDITHYELADSLPCPRERTLELAELKTRLKKIPPQLHERLINWGYAVCDAALRKHAFTKLPPPRGFPYPDVGV